MLDRHGLGGGERPSGELPMNEGPAALLAKHGIDHLHHEALLSARQVLDALHLLLLPERL